MTGPRRAVAGLAGLLAGLLVACAAEPRRADFSRLLAASPRSLLVVPVVNESVDVDAAATFLSTLPVPLAERGYYVFPVDLVKRLLEDDGLSDASLVHGADPVRLCALFGADAALYVTIRRWDAKYVVLSTQVTVELSYVVKDGRTGETLWTEHQASTYASDSGGGGQGGAAALVGALVSAALTKAAPSYLPLARQANAQALGEGGRPNGFPYGPHRPEFGSDYPRPGPAPAAPPPR